MRFVAKQGGWEQAAPYALYLFRDGEPLSPGLPPAWLELARGQSEAERDGRTLCFLHGNEGDKLATLVEGWGKQLAAQGKPPSRLSIALPESSSEPPLHAASAVVHAVARAFSRSAARPEQIELLYSRAEWSEALEEVVERTGDWARREYTLPSSCMLRLFWWGAALLLIVVIGVFSVPRAQLSAQFRSPPVALSLAIGETLLVELQLQRLDPELDFDALSVYWPPFAEVHRSGLPAFSDSLSLLLPLTRADSTDLRGRGSVRGHIILSPSDGRPVTSFAIPLRP